MQKKFKLGKLHVGLIVVIVLLSVYVFQTFSFAYIPSESDSGSVQNDGNMVSKKYDVEKFTEVSLGGNLELIYADKTAGPVVVQMSKDLFKNIEVYVDGDTLYVKQDKKFMFSDSDVAKVYIHTPELKKVNLSGASSFVESTEIETDSLSLSMSGASEVSIPVKVKKLDIEASGASSINITGTADTLKFDGSGACKFNGLELATDDSDIKISGAGEASVNCAKKLDVALSGACSLQYKGNPKIEKRISGLGTISSVQ